VRILKELRERRNYKMVIEVDGLILKDLEGPPGGRA
jgi:hypothetical protein